MPPGGISGEESNLPYPCAGRKIGAIGASGNGPTPAE